VLTHQANLAGESFTVETNERFNQRSTAKVEGSRRLLTARNGSFTQYTNGAETFSRSTARSQTLYGYSQRVVYDLERDQLIARRLLMGLVQGGDWEPTGTTTEDGQQYLELEASGVDDQQALLDNNVYYEETASVSTFFGDGLVTEDGVVREMVVTVTFSGDTEDALIEYRTSDVGSTSVSKPSWTGTAKRKAPQFELSVVDDGTYLRLRQTGGQSIDVEFEVDVSGSGTYFDGEHSGSTTGETLYLYRTGERNERGNGVLGISEGSRPSSPPPSDWSGERRVVVYADFELFQDEVTV
jgi:hypothetical protein